MKRKVLIISAWTIGLFGLAMSSIPFTQSMRPNDKQIAELPHVDISNLKHGHYIEANGAWYKAFILKNANGGLQVFSIPYWEENYRMPDLSWRRSYLPCKNFGPEAHNNQLVIDGRFKCFDEAEESWEWWKTDLRWTFDGKSLHEYTEDLMSPAYEVRGNTLIIGKQSQH